MPGGAPRALGGGLSETDGIQGETDRLDAKELSKEARVSTVRINTGSRQAGGSARRGGWRTLPKPGELFVGPEPKDTADNEAACSDSKVGRGGQESRLEAQNTVHPQAQQGDPECERKEHGNVHFCHHQQDGGSQASADQRSHVRYCGETMCHRPLTQLVLAGFLLFGCGKDPILERVDAMTAENSQGEGQRGSPGNEAVTPGIPEEPEPGIPGASTSGKPGASQGMPGGVVEPGQGDTGGEMAPGMPEEPSPGTPEDPSPGIPEDPKPAPAGSAEGGEEEGGMPGPPMKPGIPEEPKPAEPGSPGGASHAGKKKGMEAPVDGPQVLVRGQVTSAVEVRGRVRIDVFDGDQRNRTGPRPSVVAMHDMERPSWFELSIPAVHKRVWLGAYADLNDNKRPDKGEPAGWYRDNPVFLNDLPSGISIDLTVEGKATTLGLDFGGP